MGYTSVYECELCSFEHKVTSHAPPLGKVTPPRGFAVVTINAVMIALIGHGGPTLLLCKRCVKGWSGRSGGLREKIEAAGVAAGKEAFRAAQLEARGAVVALGEIVDEPEPVDEYSDLDVPF